MKRNASAVWHGSLKEGKGTISTQSGVLANTQYSFGTRFENGTGTNPEELIGAAHAGCFSMALSAELQKAGFTADTGSVPFSSAQFNGSGYALFYDYSFAYDETKNLIYMTEGWDNRVKILDLDRSSISTFNPSAISTARPVF